MAQVLDALDYAHRHGVVHRDVKAANVFVRADGTVKVADFGIAHLDTSSLTQAGQVMGTPSSMSPEQILGLPVDARTDVFSAGVILYQFVTGERPFGGAATTTTMQKVLKEDPLPPSALNVQLPDAMDAVVRRALAKKPDERFASAAAFAEALRALALPRARAAATAAPAYDGDATLVAAPARREAPPPEATIAPTPPAPPAEPAPAYARAGGSTIVAARPRMPVIAIVVGVVALAIALGLVWYMQQSATTAGRISAVAPPTAPEVAAVGPIAPSASSAPVPAVGPGSVVIAAAGYVDPNDPRYQGDASKWQADLRADARGQLVDKALGLIADRASLASNYDAVGARLASRSGDFIRTVVRESEPTVGKDGLATMTTEAVVDVKAVQKSLNEMTAGERVAVIRAGGDPRISVAVSVRDAAASGAPPQRSAVAENLLKDRVKSFGFRVWADEAAPAGRGADIAVAGEAAIRRLTTRLEASGLVVTKFAIDAFTLKAVDLTTGEEIYHDTTLPARGTSYASEEAALKAVGARVADAFSRDFFMKHVSPASRRVALVVEGLPDGRLPALVLREMVGLPTVIAVSPRPGAASRTFDVELAGASPAADLVAGGIVAPLNAKLGKACLQSGASSGDEVRVRYDAAACPEGEAVTRLETLPPAGLYGAPPSRQRR
jgi:serine/threonine-protein kinase